MRAKNQQLWPRYWILPGLVTVLSWVFGLHNGASQIFDPTPRLWSLGVISLLVTIIELMIIVGLKRRILSAADIGLSPKTQWVAFGVALVVAMAGVGLQVVVVTLNPVPIL